MQQRTRFKVFKRDNFRCQYCGKTSDEAVLEVDHITPVSRGGKDETENLITSCRECNRGKSNIEIIQSYESEENRLYKELCDRYDGEKKNELKIVDTERILKELYIKRKTNMINNIDTAIKLVENKYNNCTADMMPKFAGTEFEWESIEEVKEGLLRAKGLHETEKLQLINDNIIKITFDLSK